MAIKFYNLDKSNTRTSLVRSIRPQGYKYPTGISFYLVGVENSAPGVISTGAGQIEDGDNVYYRFTSSGAIENTNPIDIQLEYLVVAGGGSGGSINGPGFGPWNNGGGGGAGGVIYASGVPFSGLGASNNAVVIGAGGAGGAGGGQQGNPSSLGIVEATGGGLGATGPGGSGGGGKGSGGGGTAVSGQGSNGGSGSSGGGGGGGKANAGSPFGPDFYGGAGGQGTAYSLTGSPVGYGGGGGGGGVGPGPRFGGSGGFGGGGPGGGQQNQGTSGSVNTGGGGGARGNANNATGNPGGSGIVIIRHKKEQTTPFPLIN